MKLRNTLVVLAALLSSTAAMADLSNGDVLLNPALGGGGPFYSTVAPPWLVPGALAAPVLVSPTLGIPGFPSFTGTVTSAVYYVNGVDASGGLGFSYLISLAATSLGDLTRATLNPADWAGWTITDAGSTGTGASTATGAGWTDGDPYQISRAAAGNPFWQFNVAGLGTELDGGNTSAVVWFETNATAYTLSNIGLLDGGTSSQAVVYAPVPAPAAVGLGMLGFALVGHLRRKLS